MCGRSHRKTVYPTQKQGRDVHPERKGMGILSREEYSKSETRQRCTPGEEHGSSECRAVQYGGDVDHLYKTVFLGLCGHLANYPISFFNSDWFLDPPQDDCANFC